MITRKGLADEIDQIDEAIKAYNESKREAFDAYRDQLIAAGVAKANVKTEIEAVKAAIRRRRAVLKDEAAELEKSELIDEVFEEITTVSRAPRAHVENITKFDASTGEIIDDAPVTIIDQTDRDGHHIKVTVDPQIAAILARSDAGLDIVTKHTEIATNEGGANPEEADTAAEGSPNLEPTGPVAEWATDLAEDGIRYEASPPRPMKSLPYAACFPELSHAHYQQLSDSIANNGVREPIVRMGDVIVDGWSRYNISRSLGIEYPVVSYLGNDVLLDVIAWQREARQFTRSQERQIAARLAKEVPHRAADIMAAFSLTEEREMA